MRRLYPSIGIQQLILVLKSHGLYATCTKLSILVQIISHVMAYSTACINPLLYAFLSENFRKAFKKVSVEKPNNTHAHTLTLTHDTELREAEGVGGGEMDECVCMANWDRENVDQR